MTKKDLMIVVADYSQPESVSLEEFCEICGISPDLVNNMVAYEIIHPHGQHTSLQFSVQEVQRTKKALRLQRDLEVNLAGIALVFDLLEKIDELDQQLALMERHYQIRK